jgi:predicted AAA+ superfamily ATPase
MIPRTLAQNLADVASRWPVLTLTGPRQSGKTTLCRAVFPEHRYLNLERPDVREEAREDPIGLLRSAPAVILDEIQRVPELLSWIQALVDEDRQPGRFVLTGSQHFNLLAGVTQSLAGRTIVRHLLPLSTAELQKAGLACADLWEAVFRGGYPGIWADGLPPAEFQAAYVATYLERDVRQLIQVRDLATFQTLLGLVAGRTAQLLKIDRLAADVGVAHGTARSWLNALEASFVVTRLPAWHSSDRKRLVRAPKLHFVDTGVACWLLGIRTVEQLRTHPLRGPLFESWVVGEALKARHHNGHPPDLHHYRDHRGREVDLLFVADGGATAIEIKSGQTVSGSQLGPLRAFVERQPEPWRSALVYGGEERRVRAGIDLVPWDQVASLFG